MENELTIEQQKQVIADNCEKATKPLSLDAAMLQYERDSILNVVAGMRAFAESSSADVITDAVWKERITRLEAHAAVVSLQFQSKIETIDIHIKAADTLIRSLDEPPPPLPAGTTIH